MKKMTNVKNAMKLVLTSRVQIKRDILRKILRDTYGINISDRTLRLLKNELIKDGLPVGSDNGRGYYLITNEKEMNRVRAEYKSKIGGLQETLLSLERAFNDKYNKDFFDAF